MVQNATPRHAARAPEPPPAVKSTQPRGETIEECVLRSLDQYFADLNGARAHTLHDMVMRAVERPLLKFALDKAQGNQTVAAELLGINRNTLRKKIIDYGLEK